MITLTEDFVLPLLLPFDDLFKLTLERIIGEEYPLIASLRNQRVYESEEEQDNAQTDLANAIEAALLQLGFISEQTGDWMGTLYDYAEELGYDFSRETD